ncbi:MAG: hypothetical protein ABIK78_03275 [candidate division WOR-3 bacterium]
MNNNIKEREHLSLMANLPITISCEIKPVESFDYKNWKKKKRKMGAGWITESRACFYD